MGDRPRLLDLFCGAGGAGMGYYRAGFDVIGVDCQPMPRYPFEFHQADALEYLAAHGHEFEAVHASPPCQRYSSVSGRARRGTRREYPDLVDVTRRTLLSCGRPYVIENVAGAPLRFAVVLCGSSFGLDVRRHRYFECSVLILTPPCQHWRQRPRFRSLDSRQKSAACVVGVHGHLNYPGELKLRRRAMGIDWMDNRELTQALPPAYCEFIGRQLMRVVRPDAEVSACPQS
jgi:hypothetical protein